MMYMYLGHCMISNVNNHGMGTVHDVQQALTVN